MVTPPFMEPFRIKSVEPIPFPTAEERRNSLAQAGFNLFRVPARQVTVDLLTDSGTAAMSAAQWSAVFSGDESYAGARSYEGFEAVVRELTGMPEVIPVHQGRAAERILFGTLLRPGEISVANTHFDTTAASVAAAGARCIDLPGRPDLPGNTEDSGLFGGNIDLEGLERVLRGPEKVRCVVLTVTDNAGGGQPVSPANLAEVRRLCAPRGIGVLLDASRFAENAYLVTRRDPEWVRASIPDVARAMFDLADGCFASLKKDGLANTGGLIALRDAALARDCRNRLIEVEGFPTYGGLAGRDLEALTKGLHEVMDPRYLEYRAESASWFADQLETAGFPVLRPTGCHAVYVDAAAKLAHIPAPELPATALANALYLAGAVRVTDLGTLVFGGPDPEGGPDRPAPREWVRFALPRRVYTRNHLEYVADIAAQVAAKATALSGYRILEQARTLRHFTAVLAPLGEPVPFEH
nr:tryptophanase [Sciscionella marina]